MASSGCDEVLYALKFAGDKMLCGVLQREIKGEATVHVQPPETVGSSNEKIYIPPLITHCVQFLFTPE